MFHEVSSKEMEEIQNQFRILGAKNIAGKDESQLKDFLFTPGEERVQFLKWGIGKFNRSEDTFANIKNCGQVEKEIFHQAVSLGLCTSLERDVLFGNGSPRNQLMVWKRLLKRLVWLETSIPLTSEEMETISAYVKNLPMDTQFQNILKMSVEDEVSLKQHSKLKSINNSLEAMKMEVQNLKEKLLQEKQIYYKSTNILKMSVEDEVSLKQHSKLKSINNSLEAMKMEVQNLKEKLLQEKQIYYKSTNTFTKCGDSETDDLKAMKERLLEIDSDKEEIKSTEENLISATNAFMELFEKQIKPCLPEQIFEDNPDVKEFDKLISCTHKQMNVLLKVTQDMEELCLAKEEFVNLEGELLKMKL
uniref:Uncharacterized protein n=1 Tax=Timema cristinae TaxID=61476 RepID=A0A7R9CXF5_TIMCR|nr:unnamed protein product [Timema cristinae]